MTALSYSIYSIVICLLLCNANSNCAGNNEIKTIPGCPFGIYPGGGFIPLMPLMDWTDVNGATFYHLQISRYADFSILEVNIVIKTQRNQLISEYQVTQELLPLTYYWWRIEAGDDSGISGFCIQYNFITGP